MSGRPLPSSFDGDEEFFEENRLAKFGRRLREEPLIPIGCLLTCLALFKATRSIKAGSKEQTNKMFRMRIYAQAFTLAAMVGGSFYYQKERDERKAKEGITAEKKAKEKQQAWIRELEIRDREDKELRERAKKLSERRRQAEREVAVSGPEMQTVQAAETRDKP